MTRREAIEWNKNLKMYMKLSDRIQPCKFLEDNYIALDMAIQALEQDPCEETTIDNHYWKGFNNGIRTEKFRESKRRELYQDPCEDVISRKAVLEIYDEWFATCNIADKKESPKSKIQALPPVTPEQTWIPVNERLPEKNGGYLVTVKRGYVTTALWVGTAEFWNEVKAWMPLPQPYKAEGIKE